MPTFRLVPLDKEEKRILANDITLERYPDLSNVLVLRMPKKETWWSRSQIESIQHDIHPPKVIILVHEGVEFLRLEEVKE